MSLDTASEKPASMDASENMTLVVGMKKSESPLPASAVDQPKRKFPKDYQDLFEPGAEYTPWGDMIFELHDQDADGILLPDLPIEKYKQMPPAWHNSWFSPPTSLSNINQITNIGLAQMPAPIRPDRIKRRPHLGGEMALYT
jgi:hypothetical protein